jgi:hypothetical protein
MPRRLLEVLLAVTFFAACGRTAPFGERNGGPVPDGPPKSSGSALLSSSGESDAVDRFCRLSGEGVLSCWGDNHDGAPGNGTSGPTADPVIHGERYRFAAVGPRDTCGIRLDGTLWCWGLHVGAAPKQVGDGRQWKAIALGYAVAVGLQEDGSLWVWPGTLASPALVRQIDGTYRAMAMGYWESLCALRSDGTLGCSTDAISKAPLEEVGIADAQAFSVIGGQVYVATSSGKLLRRAFDEPGAPVQLDPGGATSRVSAFASVCALSQSGALACQPDQYGGVTPPDAELPFRRMAGSWAAVAVGTAHTCGIAADDSTWCWPTPDVRANAVPELTRVEVP